MSSENTQQAEDSTELPDNKTLQHASKLAIVEDKPIMMITTIY